MERKIGGKAYAVDGENGEYTYSKTDGSADRYQITVATEPLLGGRIGCSCPSWVFGQKKRPCKHMQDAVVLYIMETSGINLTRWGMYHGEQ